MNIYSYPLNVYRTTHELDKEEGDARKLVLEKIDGLRA
jgi:hypothetical protein